MKTLTLIISLALTSTLSMASSPKFQNAMEKTLGKYAQCETMEDYQALANNFAVLAKAEENEWLPQYYQAQCYVIMSFMEKSSDKKDEILIPAEELIKSMLSMVPNEPEVYVLQSMYFTAKLVVNPQERGQKYSALSNQAVHKALALDSSNPRARFMGIQNELGTAAFFKQDLTPIYAKGQQVLNEWEAFKPQSSIHPNWGKEQLEQLLAKSN